MRLSLASRNPLRRLWAALSWATFTATSGLYSNLSRLWPSLYGVNAPRQHVPKLWLEPLRRLAAARASGLTWRAALTKAGLEVPDDLEGRIRDVRAELDGVWTQLLPVVATALATAQTIGQRRIREKLEKLSG